jgi:hypothetical protein
MQNEANFLRFFMQLRRQRIRRRKQGKDDWSWACSYSRNLAGVSRKRGTRLLEGQRHKTLSFRGGEFMFYRLAALR